MIFSFYYIKNIPSGKSRKFDQITFFTINPLPRIWEKWNDENTPASKSSQFLKFWWLPRACSEACLNIAMRGIKVTFSPNGGVCFWEVAWQKDASIFKRLSVMVLFATDFKFPGVTTPSLSLSLSLSLTLWRILYANVFCVCPAMDQYVCHLGSHAPHKEPTERPPWICIYRVTREPTALKLIISIQMQKQYFNDAFAWKAILFELVSDSSIISEYISPLWNLGWAYCEKEALMRRSFFTENIIYMCVCPRYSVISIIYIITNWSCKYFSILCSNDMEKHVKKL